MIPVANYVNGLLLLLRPKTRPRQTKIWYSDPLETTTSLDTFSLTDVVFITTLCLVMALLYSRQRRVKRLTHENFDRLSQAGFVSDTILGTYPEGILYKSICNEDASLTTAGALKAREIMTMTTVLVTETIQKKPFKRGYVFIGGFGDTPAMWNDLAHAMELQGHFVMCPRTPGWGRNSFDEIKCVGWREWVISAMESVAVAQRICEHVTAIGHSTGALTVGLMCERMAVDRVVFTGPNFLPSPTDANVRKLLLHPMLGPLFEWWLVVIPKKKRKDRPVDNLNSLIWEKGYYLTSMPLHAIRQMWEAQDMLTTEWKVKEVVMLQGQEDKSVAAIADQIPRIEPLLPAGVAIRAEVIPNAAHGLPTETLAVIRLVADILLE